MLWTDSLFSPISLSCEYSDGLVNSCHSRALTLVESGASVLFHIPAEGKSFYSLSQVVKACNEGVRKMSRTEQMISIQKKLEFKIKV